MKNFFLLKYILIVVSLFIFISCEDDDPVTPQSEHFEAIGMIFYDSGIEIARILRGETSDTLIAEEGERTSHMDIKFFDEDENIIDPPEGEEQNLSWEFDDPTIAGIWQHEGEEGGFEIHIDGLKSGETYVEFFVMHEGHADYRSGKIPVRIDEHSGETHGAPIGLELIDEESGNMLLTITNDDVEGQLSVNAGETSEHIEVEFFDANNIMFQPEVPPHSLSVESADESILTITGLSEDEPWAFKLQGVSAGTTTVTIKIMHDESVGKEFPPITVNVN